MNHSEHSRFWLPRVACSAGVFLISSAPLAAADSTAVSGLFDLLPVLLSVGGFIFGIAALVIAVRASKQAGAALQEAGEARARTQTSNQSISADSLAATERVWSTRLNALEAQMQNSHAARGARPLGSQDRHASGDLNSRVEEIEKSVAGFAVFMTQNRKSGVGVVEAPAVSTPELPWPAVLKTEKQGIKELRDLLQEGSKLMPAELESLFQKLNVIDTWSVARRPSFDETLTFLKEVSQTFHTLLRKGASLPAHEGSRMADRLLGLLRPVWQKYHPAVDCRIFYPGTPFDPEWMEDQNPAGMRRPTITEMFSWAVHEKQSSGRRIVAKARVTTE